MLDTVTLLRDDSNLRGQIIDQGLRMDDLNPRGATGVLQPKPRRLLPMQLQPLPPDEAKFVDLRKSSALTEDSCPGGSLRADDTAKGQELSTEVSLTNHGPFHPVHEMPNVLDLSAKRLTPFSVLDLLGKPDTNRTGSSIPAPIVPQATFMHKMNPILHPGVPGVFQYKLDNIARQHETYKPQTEHNTSPPVSLTRKMSPVRRRSSVTSSPESPRSDSSVSDTSDPNTSSETSPKFCSRQDKKSNRTSYTPHQVRQLEKVFLETPYPEHEVYEQLSQTLCIPEPRLKVWFQNKRARWKRRAEDKMALTSGYHIPMMPMGYPYSILPGPVSSPQESSNVSRSHMMYQGGVFPSLYPYQAPPMYARP